ncbi:hypothetical protein DY000_02061514 [Brassica cretica]|uniref:Uncharacterized protein n=1 Tax=Brassica cretica TaxID=69181 RepID=A0ABQ7AZM0_BRACR|nr:hypothetical protein DY000_02061514 [Brassica cretica]
MTARSSLAFCCNFRPEFRDGKQVVMSRSGPRADHVGSSLLGQRFPKWLPKHAPQQYKLCESASCTSDNTHSKTLQDIIQVASAASERFSMLQDMIQVV